MTKHIVSQKLSVHQQHELLLVLEKAGLTDELAQAIIQSPDNALARKIVQIVQGNMINFRTFSISVDYNDSVSSLINAGAYAWVDPEIAISSKSIRGSETGKVSLNIQLLRFGRVVATDTVLEEMKKLKLRPVTIKELLGLGATPQVTYPQMTGIVSLGTKLKPPISVGVMVATIYICHGQPELRLMGMHESLWGKDWYFAAVEH